MKKYFIISLSLFLTGCMTAKTKPRITFEAPGCYPEGVAYDKNANVFYVSSERTGTVGKVTPQGKYTVLYADEGLKSSYGMKVSPDGKTLYVCVSDANYSKYTSPDTRKKMIRLIGIDIASGRKMTDVDLSGIADGKHFGNDIAFDDKGNIYMTDSYSNVIYKITAGGAATLFCKSKMFDTKGVGLNGIVCGPGYLLVDNTATGCIYKVDMNNPENVQKVTIDQHFLGADGLLMTAPNSLVVVVNGGTNKVYRLTSDDTWNTAKLAAFTPYDERFTYPATATMDGAEIWVMDAKTNELVDSNNAPSKFFAIQQAELVPIPKKYRQ